MDHFKQGDIVWLDLDPTTGDELKKTRPCLVLEGRGHSRHKLFIVVPIKNDDGGAHSGVYVPIEKPKTSGLTKNSLIDCYQIRAVSHKRFGKKIGVANTQTVDKTLAIIAVLLRIKSKHLLA